MKQIVENILHERLHAFIILRHELHQIPEVGFNLPKTASKVRQTLTSLGLQVREPFGRCGIIADLDTGRTGPDILLRAEMDGLPIQETSGLPWQSQYPGFAHSCGHDGHMTITLATAEILTRIKDHLRGRIRFLFQPAEEIGQGARAMIEDGVLNDISPNAVFALHSWCDLEADSVGCKPGTMLASCDLIRIKVTGKGGHGAHPENTNNPLPGMARIIEKIQTLNDNPQRIVSLCTASIGSQANIIDDVGTLSGTLRTLNEEIWHDSVESIKRIVEHSCRTFGLRGEVRFDDHTPAVVTDDRLFKVFMDVSREWLGDGKTLELKTPSMGSEDFGYFMQQSPGILFRLGIGPDSPQLHESRFDFNDQALACGIKVMTGMACKLCDENSNI